MSIKWAVGGAGIVVLAGVGAVVVVKNLPDKEKKDKLEISLSTNPDKSNSCSYRHEVSGPGASAKAGTSPCRVAFGVKSNTYPE